MKKIINGKLYNTETAQELGTYWNGKSRRDLEFFEETLYLKRTGEFFIYGIGGPASRYSRSCPTGGWDGDERITPVSYDDAKKWAEDRLSASEYEAVFGQVTEGDDDTIIVKLPAELGGKLRQYARENGLTITDVIADMVKKI